MIPWAPCACALTGWVLARVLPWPPASEDMPPALVPAAPTAEPPTLVTAAPALPLMLLMGPLMAAPFVDAAVPAQHEQSARAFLLSVLATAVASSRNRDRGCKPGSSCLLQ